MSIDRDQAILIASRTFAAFLLFWVIVDMIELPRELLEVVHYFRESGRAGMGISQAMLSSHVLTVYMMYFLANILRIALWLLAAGWFYRCGPRIRRFFVGKAE